MRRQTVVFTLLLIATAFAARPWTPAEIDAYGRANPPQWLPCRQDLVRGPRRINYLQRIHLTCGFIRQYQVADSLSPDFGGIIEAEHLPSVIETDNTQEAVWVWSRWYELTGDSTYRTNIRRAWTYVLRHPAYREHGGQPTSLWYAVWNCGLGFMAETQYRHTFGDTSLRPYADTCRNFYIQNRLQELTSLDWFVTAQAAGMAYAYALDRNDALLAETALARGSRVKAWVQQSPRNNLASQNWAMCGGTAFWGVMNSVGRADTAAGRVWAQTYAESLPGFYPGGSWNCSHNIWLANAWRSAAERTSTHDWWLVHQYLTDTLLSLDTDLDGGIPATWTDQDTMDQTWVSTYVDFMGMDPLVTPLYQGDLAAFEFTEPDPRGVHMAGETLSVDVPIANVGLLPRDGSLTVTAPGYNQTVNIPGMPLYSVDTFEFQHLVATSPGIYEFTAALAPDDNAANDTVRLAVKVYGIRTVSGTLTDSTSGDGLHAWLYASITGSTVIWDSCETDRSGSFTLHIIDTTVAIAARMYLPYYDRSWNFTIQGDTTLDLVTQTAHVCLVNNDSAGRHESYYTTALDSLELAWSVWNRATQGELPYSVLGQLRARTLIWYSGDTRTGTIPAADQDSMTSALAGGVNLVITGQNIAEELQATPFLESTIGCRFDSTGWSGFLCWGDRADSLGSLITGTATAGGGGANNQTSRDVITPLGNSDGFIVYDTVNVRYAAIRRDCGTARLVFLGFGFEAVNRPNPRPTYWGRTRLLGLILDWFSPGIGIAERQPTTARPPLAATVVHSSLMFPTSGGTVRIFDASGRIVLAFTGLLESSTPRTLDLSALAPGIYFAQGGSAPVRFIRVR